MPWAGRLGGAIRSPLIALPDRPGAKIIKACSHFMAAIEPLTDLPQEAAPAAGSWRLTVGSIGVVFGDIGTSPLYAFREAAHNAAGAGVLTRPIVLGVLSLVLWSLFIVVTAKYVLLLLRADTNGVGGAAMFLGDSMITPAISVLSAVEGLKLAAPAFEHYVVPLTVLILVALFAVQSSGTQRIASAFGPVMILWLLALAALGAWHIADDPSVLAAINPYYGVSFMLTHGHISLVTLGAVFLCVTGGEALYADLGHFGRKSIQSAWLFFVLPALILNYFGQGAMLLAHPDAIDNTFYRMVPPFLLVPAILLATAATVFASQAVITGAYSLTRQAIQLGLLPRFEIRYTSEV